MLRRDTEEHFERCIHALEVRRDTLLNELDELAQQQGISIFPSHYYYYHAYVNICLPSHLHLFAIAHFECSEELMEDIYKSKSKRPSRAARIS